MYISVIKRYSMAVTQYGFLQPKTIELIKEIEKYPVLYDPEMLICRSRRQEVWDVITKKCGYSKTEETKNKWRSLVGHLRQHLENVEKKTLRRYIPKTDNPNDQYLQLEDWHYYKYMKFMTPYIKPRKPRLSLGAATQNGPKSDVAADRSKAQQAKVQTHTLPATSVTSNVNRTTISTTATKSAPMSAVAATGNVGKTPIQLQIGGMIFKIQVDKPQSAPHVVQQGGSNNSNKNNVTINVMTAPNVNTTHTATDSSQSSDTFQHLSVNDQNLKSFFDAMLRSTQRLPKYHQERIKEKLLKVISAQK